MNFSMLCDRSVVCNKFGDKGVKLLASALGMNQIVIKLNLSTSVSHILFRK